MFCGNCGKEIDGDSIFCPYCGTRLQETGQSFYQKFEYDGDDYDLKLGDDYPVFRERDTRIRNAVNIERGRRRESRKEKLSCFSFAKFLLLSIITFGVYPVVVLYRFNKTVNILCKGDEQETPNYIVVMLLATITFGIYSHYWIYKQAKRLYEIAPKYRCKIEETGIPVLLWSTFGTLILIGPLVVWHKMFSNANLLIKNYNRGQINEQYVAVNNRNKKAIGILVGFYSLWIVLLIGTMILLASVFLWAGSAEMRMEQVGIVTEAVTEVVPEVTSEKTSETFRQIVETSKTADEKSEGVGRTNVEDNDYTSTYDFASHKVTNEIVRDDEAGNNNYIFPNSDNRYLSETEVCGKNLNDLALGRNEIYARHGYIFQDASFRPLINDF